jgi:hypothetical protein
VAERAGEGFLCDIFCRCSIEAADLQGTHQAAVVRLVNLDEVARRSGGRIG